MPASISIVIPVYNEEESILILLDEIYEVCSKLPTTYEIVLVDDGSTDNTTSVIENYKAKSKNKILLVKHGCNKGQSAALLTGIRASNYSWVMTLDGDGQNDPQDIPIFLDFAREHKGMPFPILAIGNRHLRQDSFIKKLSSRIANHFRTILLQDNCLDAGCGLKFFRKNDVLNLPLFDHFHRFLPALITAAGGAVYNIPVHHRPRVLGQSKYGVWNRLWVGIVDILGVLWLRRRARCWSVKT